jgi:signal transduction histidine kinase/ActR/RegA family two-component response regulator
MDDVKRVFQSFMETGEVRNAELQLKRKDGTKIDVSLNISAVRDDQGNIIYSRSAWRDITERKLAEEREKQLQQELILASRLATAGEMAAGIAHEINNPLTGVIGFSSLLMKKDIPEDIRKDVNIIYDGAQRIADITGRMLSYTRQRKPERTSVNVNDIIENTLALRAYEMESSGIQVETRLDPDLPITTADAGQLQQVFLNIILNAEVEMIQAHGKGNLSVKTERIDNTIRVSFKDDGPGIPKKNLDKIFDPFFTTREVGQGAGLGLSVCHGIISQHRGKIYAQSRLGKGATFFVELPIVTKAEQLKLAEVAAKEPERVSRGRILVVDDDPIVQQFLNDVLTEEGHDVEIVENGEDALGRIDSEEYDVILLDIKLPGMSGIELYKYMQKAAKSLARRVVFITGDVMSKDTMSFLSRTKASYITKPFDAEQLKKEIDRIISQQS